MTVFKLAVRGNNSTVTFKTVIPAQAGTHTTPVQWRITPSATHLPATAAARATRRVVGGFNRFQVVRR
jgi:hypothetical protein